MSAPAAGAVGETRAARPLAYHPVQVALHWLVAALVVGQYATSGAIVRTHSIHLIGQRPSAADLVLHALHNRLGLLVLVLMGARLALRLAVGAPRPGPTDGGTRWIARGAAAAHAAFYAVLIAEASAGAVASYLWWPASALHVALFYVLAALVALHVAAAAGHRLAGDGVFARMSPRAILKCRPRAGLRGERS
ncbi:cytochrome b/b6 domain-containing protein [Lichenibacterium dinghuense]|jgi:cytochrome b561|uniref:cytochrome b/b6 domain-containing protein n=1 Tax=Lichenibacterium dinghuense TaxID=2895977 RepID=UPI001F020000|nr:cytochrome b/b6 domain-containing protein [Lichenibacterium sp. 6Y81]